LQRPETAIDQTSVFFLQFGALLPDKGAKRLLIGLNI
jgi:hypothetical protein